MLPDSRSLETGDTQHARWRALHEMMIDIRSFWGDFQEATESDDDAPHFRRLQANEASLAAPRFYRDRAAITSTGAEISLPLLLSPCYQGQGELAPAIRQLLLTFSSTPLPTPPRDRY